ncbi:hypothetical protein ACFO1B_32700 [Dactylosporangium siamense]|uniref:Lipoprotein n=1 Tax=Dactylosporangium siamense TaxID=685454 RepID=A0A919PPN6_9ACTN|nr:hypothetical protein [Dactylosporangium siamense]GIG46205.1 hypothetical protein Dsi01nite_042460 [Dactylosporangium siamense]
MTRLRTLAATMVLLLAGCGDPAPVGGGGVPGAAVNYRPDELVLRVDVSGGLVPVAMTVTEVPTLSIYGDGRVVTNGPMIEIFPGPALPNVQVQGILAPSDITKLARMALDAGVGQATDFGMPNVADAPTTHIMVRTVAGTQASDIPALGIGEDSLSAPHRAARQRMQRLVEALTDLESTLGKGTVSESRPFVAKGVAAVAVPWAEMGGDQGVPPQAPVAWPGPALPGEAVADRPGVHCAGATGEESSRILAAAGKANSRTPWTSAGSSWQVTFRPFLPDESTCADLAHRP